jgi:hypothetical protein
MSHKPGIIQDLKLPAETKSVKIFSPKTLPAPAGFGGCLSGKNGGVCQNKPVFFLFQLKIFLNEVQLKNKKSLS